MKTTCNPLLHEDMCGVAASLNTTYFAYYCFVAVGCFRRLLHLVQKVGLLLS